MLGRSKGSILITSLMVFTIVTMTCITCSGLILSNNRIFKLDYENEVLKQGNLGIIEIVHSNILNELKNALSNTNNEDEFYNYFTVNNSRNFINKVKDISGSDFSSGEVSITFDEKYSSKEYLHYKILTKYKVNNYDKYARVCFKIKNPWYNSNIENEETNNEDLNEAIEIDNDINLESNEQDIKIDEKDIVIFYNYEEN